MSESRNPLDIFSETGLIGSDTYQRGVAFEPAHSGGYRAVTRSQLGATDPTAIELVTLIRAKSLDNGDYMIDREAYTAIDMLISNQWPRTVSMDEFLAEREGSEAFFAEQCYPYNTEAIPPQELLPEEGTCPNPVILLINGFSGPGYAPLCAQHAPEPIKVLNPQVWVPIKVSLRELDELIYHGALRPNWV